MHKTDRVWAVSARVEDGWNIMSIPVLVLTDTASAAHRLAVDNAPRLGLTVLHSDGVVPVEQTQFGDLGRWTAALTPANRVCVAADAAMGSVGDTVTLDIDELPDPTKALPTPTRDQIETLAQPVYGELFGNPEDGAAYALLDAALIPNLPEILETSGLPHCCLFQGEAFDTLAEAAPWLIQLTPDAAFTRALLSTSKAPWHHWDKRAGVFLRSTATLDALRKHFRRFVRVQDGAGVWFYFRFWSPGPLSHYLRHAGGDDDRAGRLLRVEDQPIRYLVPGKSSVLAVRPAETQSEVPGTSKPFRLTDEDRNLFRDYAMFERIERMAIDLRRLIPDDAAHLDDLALLSATRQSVARMRRFGFNLGQHLFVLAAWDVAYGHGHERRDPEGQLEKILTADINESSKYQFYKKRIETIGMSRHGERSGRQPN